MNAILTIVAKNYVGLAQVLVDSIREFNKSDEIYIVIADEVEDVTAFEREDYFVIPAAQLNIDDYESLAFKYNVTEFCTAVKPFAIDYIFKERGTDRIIYFDPDIYLYQDVKVIFDKLDDHVVILTPHFLTPEIDYTGNVDDSAILFGGMYNLGFIALKRTEKVLYFVKWWEKRLHERCYDDKWDALYVDQKWADYATIFLGEELLIERGLGHNIAYWNIHERVFFEKNGDWMVRNRILPSGDHPLVFIHFSGFDPRNTKINRHCKKLDLGKYPDWNPLLQEYETACKGKFEAFLSFKYSYAQFDNGVPIVHFYRRIYRQMLGDGHHFAAMFSATGGFYALLNKNGLILKGGQNIDKVNESNLPNFEGKLNKLHRILKVARRVLGLNRYILLLKFFGKYSRPENQTFLIER